MIYRKKKKLVESELLTKSYNISVPAYISSFIAAALRTVTLLTDILSVSISTWIASAFTIHCQNDEKTIKPHEYGRFKSKQLLSIYEMKRY
ncbi:hypothetical protein ACH3XW_22260 [Acanthocheilonema viteae]